MKDEVMKMSLYEQWEDLCNKQRTPQESNMYWSAYFDTEKEAYKKILISKEEVVEGTVAELADKFEMTKPQTTGFIDGINTSLKEEVDINILEAETQVKLEIIWEKLYENMLNAKADWLYNLEEWDGILSAEQRQDIKKAFNSAKMAVSTKVGRNEPCPCGSGKKYKNCCIK